MEHVSYWWYCRVLEDYPELQGVIDKWEDVTDLIVGQVDDLARLSVWYEQTDNGIYEYYKEYLILVNGKEVKSLQGTSVLENIACAIDRGDLELEDRVLVVVNDFERSSNFTTTHRTNNWFVCDCSKEYLLQLIEKIKKGGESWKD